MGISGTVCMEEKKKLRLLERPPMVIFPTRHGKKNPKFHRSFRIRNSAYQNRFTSKNRIIHLNPVMSSRFFRASSRESQILKSVLTLCTKPKNFLANAVVDRC